MTPIDVVVERLLAKFRECPRRDRITRLMRRAVNDCRRNRKVRK